MSILSLFGQASDYEYTPYDYSTSTTTTYDEATPAVMAGLLIVYLIAIVAIYVITSLSLSRIFKKAGVEGWKAWVPFYNNWVMLELGGQQGFWAVLMIVPLVNIAAGIFTLIAMYHIGLKLGKSGAFVLLAIFLPLVWYIWLAVDKSTWEGGASPAVAAPQPVAPMAPQQQPPVMPNDDNRPTPPPIV